MPSASRHQKWNLHRVHGPRKALVVMRVAGEDRMRPQPRRRAGAINIRQQQRAAAMLFTASERRMMHRDNHRTGKLVALHPLQRRRQKSDLAAIEYRILPVLAPDDSRVLEHIAVHPQDATERTFL